MKIGIVFDNRLRSETTGFYCRRALSKMADVEHLLPEELATIPANVFDLFLFVDDGLDYELPHGLRPSAAWAIDTHMDMQRAIERFGNADWVFAAQKNGAEQMGTALGRPVSWLPLACDPELHRPVAETEKVFDIGFVGHPVGKRRCELLDALEMQFPNSWIGQAFHNEMAIMFSQFNVAFNCSVGGDVNMRVFEAQACGCPLVTDDIDDNGLHELFDVGEHLVCYRNSEELLAAVERLNSDEELRLRLADQGRRHVLSCHTYQHRMQTLLKRVSAPSKTPLPAQESDRVSPNTKSVDYFEFDRPDVASLVPHHAKRILDIGCGGGRLGASLKQRQHCVVIGIEKSPAAAQRARSRIDQVIEAAIHDVKPDRLAVGSVDCIVLADVLEHLRTPLETLKLCREWLAEDGSLVVSVPNNQHHSVVSGLVEGNWTYERAGLLDDDHVRCFTRSELERLLFRGGFSQEQSIAIPGDGYAEWVRSGKPLELAFGRLRIACNNESEAEDFFVYQNVVRAVPRARRSFGLTSIIIVTYNQIRFTKQCIDSITQRTSVPYELIFVDNGSTDGTPEYLQTVEGARVILNSENLGFAGGVNQGIMVAQGKQILLLNNDTVVTTGWLEGLLEALYDRPDTGLVGPVSNQVSGPQQIAVDYEQLTSLDGFAWKLRSQREMTEVDRLVGFCLLMRREVVDAIGELDEQFKIGCFEDDDYCRRALEAGFKAYIAQHIFVHHFGSVTFKASGLDFAAIMKENQARYEKKWLDTSTESSSHHTQESERQDSALGLSPPPEFARSTRANAPSEISSDAVKAHYEIASLESGQQLLKRRSVTISLCMIVRDNEDTIHACLDSIYPWVDEIIVVDTGSTDGTQEICRSFGARMFEFPWCDDFSAARNISLQHAQGDWLFWMDSDDTIPMDQAQQLRRLALGEHAPETFGYVAQVRCPSGNTGEMTVVDHVKLFRNLPELRFEHCIHEQILPAIRRAGGNVEFTDIYVIHSGSIQTPEVRQKKLERDFRILKKDLQQRPEHPFVLFNLGMTCEDSGDFEAAEDYLRRCIAASGEQESHVRKAWALRVNCMRATGKLIEAIEMASSALQIFPGDKELLFRRAMLYQDTANYQDAMTDYERVLEESGDRVFQSFDPSICGYKALHNLASVFQTLGRHHDAVERWEQALEIQPGFRPAWLGLFRSRIDLGELDSAKEKLKSLPVEVDDATRALAAAIVAEAEGDWNTAHHTLEAAWEMTGDCECLDEACRILMHAGQLDRAIPSLQKLDSARPQNAAVLHNLGAALHAKGDSKTAIPYLEASIQLRPDGAHTTSVLADAYAKVGEHASSGHLLSSVASRREQDDVSR